MGLYVLAVRLLQLPITLISASLSQVFFQRATEVLHAGGDLYKLVIRATLSLIGIGLLPAAAVMVWGPELFAFALGNEWERAGVYAQWLMLWLFFMFINPPAISLYRVYRIEDHHLLQSSLLLIARATGLTIGGVTDIGDVATIAIFAVISTIANVILVWHVLRVCKLKSHGKNGGGQTI